MFTGEPLDDGGKALRRKSLVFELNRSGKYHAMKERLKDAALVIIKAGSAARHVLPPTSFSSL